ncbi:DnaD domain-containing protein [Lysinibacillus endophyticus]|uniref:DnaD domain protein n=1 Tax=Ureibacillus endophyticus TaxID=1978490 RepID=A0A494Z215_9BACL|nr:DnaD domain-containing protein [Lysinibacillus endophyticus]MCP1144308.1 DnaD domain-containing protein [Lysinibacillus endophyticus]RKQ16526.1 DnaD domain protein [Lysinibacillus endophyticus]
MNAKNQRLRMWSEQVHVNVPQLFFQHYKALKIPDDEALLLLHLLAFHTEQNDFPTPADLSERLHFNENDITLKLQRLIQKGFLEITQGIDAHGKLYEKYSIYPLWERILDYIETSTRNQEQEEEKNEEGAIFSLFEQEFGRLLSPMEIETISMWIDVDRHSPSIIKAALKEAVLAGKISLRYIDRILFEWKKKNITSVKQVEKHTEQFHQKTTTVQPKPQAEPIQKKVPFYNWLEERE